MWNCAVANHCSLDDCLVRKDWRFIWEKIEEKLSLLKQRKKKTSWGVGGLDFFICGKWTTKKKIDFCWPFFLVLSPEVNVVLTLLAEVESQDNEKLIYRWETKRVALLTSCWLPVEMYLLVVVVAFGFCRCMPSNSSRVTDPFPRKLHWNILTVTLCLTLKPVVFPAFLLRTNSRHLNPSISGAESHLRSAENLGEEITLSRYIHVIYGLSLGKLMSKWWMYN